MEIAQALEDIRTKLPSTVKLVAVSKFKPSSAVMEAYAAGQRAFGENRPQEMMAKAMELPSDIEWHFIGHLQTNKVRMVVPFAAMIESVHSRKLLGAIDACAASAGKIIDCLLEVHIADDEQSKQGFTPEELLALVPEFGRYVNVRFRGVMGMASFTDDADTIRRQFRSLRETFLAVRAAGEASAALWLHGFDQISMGMSSDWPVAVEEGATIVRIGSSIFGARQQ